jgi:hypothetical protein
VLGAYVEEKKMYMVDSKGMVVFVGKKTGDKKEEAVKADREYK